MAATPVKTITRLQLTPTTKQYVCIICGENIREKDYRLKLFHKDAKTSHCHLVEKHLNVFVSKFASTDHVCRSCIRKLCSIENKVSDLKEKYNTTMERLQSSHGKKSKKRLLKEPDLSSKKASSVLQECTPKTENALAAWYQHMDITEQRDTSSFNALSPGYRINKGLITLLSKNDYQSAAVLMMKNSEICQVLVEEFAKETKEHLKHMCKKDTLSPFRGQNKELLENFSVKSASEELRQKLSLLWNFLMGSTSDPKQESNKFKRDEALIPQLVYAEAGLIHLYNREMNIFQCINSLIMLKGGCKKAAFTRLNATGNCLSYRGTLDMADRLASNWETQLAKWKLEVETSAAIEEAIEKQIETLDETIDLVCESAVCETLILELDQLQCSLIDHRKTMHPGFYFVGDNVDLRTQVRQMTLKNQAKDFHMYNMCAYMNRVSGNNLDNTKPKGDINSVPFSEFIPGEELHGKLMEELAFLVAHEWCDRIVWLRPFKKALPTYIQHPYMKETRQKTQRVNMGVLMKNEQYNDQMVDICQFLHKYVPGHEDDEEHSSQTPQKVLSGGDYLTFERHKSAQSSMANCRTPSSRLEGLVPKMEEFHNQAELLKVIWRVLYSTKSSKDIGTLYAARNTINARNVTDEPSDNFYASTEFLNKFDAAYIICGGLKHFGMISIESDPTVNLYMGSIGDQTGMREFILCEAKLFLKKYVELKTPVIPEYGLQSNSLLCRFCHKKYKKTKKLRKHESAIHGIHDPLYTPDESPEPSEGQENDGILNYTCTVLLLGLLRLNHADAIRMGDGQRIMDINMYLCLLYKNFKCPKYAYGILETIAQSKVLLTERLAHRLIWNRTVNHRGKPDTNHPNDLDLEHQNKLFKDQIHNYRGIFTERSISRVSRSAAIIDKILTSYDKSVKVFKPSGEHTSANNEEDIMTLVKSFQQRRVFDFIPGRLHSQFENIKSNPFQSLEGEVLRDWISASIKKYSQEHFY